MILRYSSIIAVFTLFVLVGGGFVVAESGQSKTDITVLELNEKIKDRKSKINSIRKQIQIYQANIRDRRSKASSLESEVSIIEDDVAQKQLEIQVLEEEIEEYNLEIKQADLRIQEAEAEIALHKERLSSFLRQLYYNSDVDALEVLLTQESLSDFFDSFYYLERAHADVKQTLVRIKVLREQLLAQRTTLEQQKRRQEELRGQLAGQKDQLEERREAKQQIIVQSLLTADKFEKLLEEARAEQSQIDAEVAEFERSIRQRLKLQSEGPFAFAWPVDPSRGITTRFHDPDYPFRYVFEHPGIDIRAYQGSQVKAAEAGYVGRVQFSGKKYAYVMIVHDDGFATVYGHLNRIIVEQDTYVKKGQVIGLSGGAPGTNGSGPLTTGPHLHLELRKNGIPVDPLKYLP
ncbi:peptidoglycan DD-metalloendopeptidase family protein [Candidatus Uhrbacteria bacterium]|nr:peptidoglycan DD-metalloendopeptidase family protein [Candidatus Uhrbacteria bacterium]